MTSLWRWIKLFKDLREDSICEEKSRTTASVAIVGTKEAWESVSHSENPQVGISM